MIVNYEFWRSRVDELVDKLGVLQAGGKIKLFDEDKERAGDGYMFALMEIPAGERKMWVIFFPNCDVNYILLVFDRRAPWNAVIEAKEKMDQYYRDKAYEFDEDCAYPQYLWDHRDKLRYKKNDVKNALVRAVAIDSNWAELLNLPLWY